MLVNEVHITLLCYWLYLELSTCNIPSPKAYICKVFKWANWRWTTKGIYLHLWSLFLKRQIQYPCRVLHHYSETGPKPLDISSIFRDERDRTLICATECLFLVITSDQQGCTDFCYGAGKYRSRRREAFSSSSFLYSVHRTALLNTRGYPKFRDGG